MSSSNLNIEKDNFLDSILVFIKGALVFTVSQAWNSAIQNLIEKNVFLSNYGKVYYAILITFLAVYILKIINNLKKIWKSCQETVNGKCQNFNLGKVFSLRGGRGKQPSDIA